MASLSRSTANRAIHLRITPRPSDISESREVLRLLSQFGEVEYFKNLKYDTLSHPNASLVIFRDESAAKTCLHRTPIRFRLGPVEAGFEEEERVEREPAPAVDAAHTPTQTTTTTTERPPPRTAPYGISQTRSLSTSTHSLPTAPRPPPTLPFLPPSQHAQPPPSRIFQIIADPARAAFRDLIDRNEYHGRFMVDGKTAIQQDLARRVPSVGLSCWDWRKGSKPDRIVQGMQKKRERGLWDVWEDGEGAGKRRGRV